MARYARWAIAGAALGGVVAALGGLAIYHSHRLRREWDAFWEESG